jgi:hypothetical protein
MNMMSEIRDGLSALKNLGGFRRILWATLLVGLSLIVFESVTQYFSLSALQTKVELLDSLRQIEGAQESDEKLTLMHEKLVDEARSTYREARNPGHYLLDVLVRFFQGAYLSLPLFYLFFKGIGFVVRNATDEMKEDVKVKTMGLFLGSLVFSSATWMATILGAASVLWNKSNSTLVSWFVFPVISAVLLIVVVLWLLALSILVRETNTRTNSEGG